MPRLEAIPHLKRAIELDPDFAMAQALLSGVYANTGRSALAPEFSRKAFELRDRVSERERFFISWRYYLDVDAGVGQGARAGASRGRRPIRARRSPSTAWASPPAAFGDHAKGVEALREAIRLDPLFPDAVRKSCRIADRPRSVRRGEGDRAASRRRGDSTSSASGERRTRLDFIAGDEAPAWPAN